MRDSSEFALLYTVLNLLGLSSIGTSHLHWPKTDLNRYTFLSFSYTDRTRVDLGSISNSRGSGGSNSRGSHDLGSRNESNNKIYPLAYNDTKDNIDTTTAAVKTTITTAAGTTTGSTVIHVSAAPAAAAAVAVALDGSEVEGSKVERGGGGGSDEVKKTAIDDE